MKNFKQYIIQEEQIRKGNMYAIARMTDAEWEQHEGSKSAPHLRSKALSMFPEAQKERQAQDAKYSEEQKRRTREIKREKEEKRKREQEAAEKRKREQEEDDEEEEEEEDEGDEWVRSLFQKPDNGSYNGK